MCPSEVRRLGGVFVPAIAERATVDVGAKLGLEAVDVWKINERNATLLPESIHVCLCLVNGLHGSGVPRVDYLREALRATRRIVGKVIVWLVLVFPVVEAPLVPSFKVTCKGLTTRRVGSNRSSAGLERRGQLVRARSRAKNEIHAALMRRLIAKPKVSDLFGVEGRNWLACLELPDCERETVDGCLRQIE